MEKPRPSTIGWATLIGGIAAYDFLCKDGDTLTERAWDLQKSRLGKAVVTGVIGATALHLLHLLPPAVDPFVHLGKLKRLRK